MSIEQYQTYLEGLRSSFISKGVQVEVSPKKLEILCQYDEILSLGQSSYYEGVLSHWRIQDIIRGKAFSEYIEYRDSKRQLSVSDFLKERAYLEKEVNRVIENTDLESLKIQLKQLKESEGLTDIGEEVVDLDDVNPVDYSNSLNVEEDYVYDTDIDFDDEDDEYEDGEYEEFNDSNEEDVVYDTDIDFDDGDIDEDIDEDEGFNIKELGIGSDDIDDGDYDIEDEDVESIGLSSEDVEDDIESLGLGSEDVDGEDYDIEDLGISDVDDEDYDIEELGISSDDEDDISEDIDEDEELWDEAPTNGINPDESHTEGVSSEGFDIWQTRDGKEVLSKIKIIEARIAALEGGNGDKTWDDEVAESMVKAVSNIPIIGGLLG